MFAHIGKNCRISEKASFHSPERIWIGDNVRIDDFALLSAGEGIVLGNYVHIGCFSYKVGSGKLFMEDYSSLSGRVSVYCATDDYSGEFLTNPTTPLEMRNVFSAPVTIKRHVIVGSGSVIMPGVEIGTGSAIGGNSLVTKNIPEFQIWAGTPARFIKERSRGCLQRCE